MNPEQRERVREGFDHVRELTPEQRQRLREKWQNATPEERAQMIERRRLKHERRRREAEERAAD
jgi:hypothetical protein